MTDRISRGLAAALALLLAWQPARAAAQAQSDARIADRGLASREDLTALAANLESAGGDPNTLGRVRHRLTEGDFRPGDRVQIIVQGDTALSQTFTVWPDLSLHLPSPTVGSLPLRGVLRSELETTVSTFIRRFIRNPVVRARPMVRLSIQGEVAKAGYYVVPADAELGEAFMVAGGTTSNANLGKSKVERNGRRVMDSDALQNAMARGMTLDEAGVREGDQIVIGRRGTGVTDNIRFAALLISIGVGVTTLATRL